VKPCVIDASVAVKWFVHEDAGRDAALALLDRIQADPRPYVVPELFFNEMLAVLCKLLGEPSRIIDYVRALEQLGLERIGNGSQLLACAATLARTHRLSGYDAIYAASAQLIGGRWLTADERVHQKLRPLGLSELLVRP
jgi:predicted nucleic acid-binding protein